MKKIWTCVCLFTVILTLGGCGERKPDGQMASSPSSDISKESVSLYDFLELESNAELVGGHWFFKMTQQESDGYTSIYQRELIATLQDGLKSVNLLIDPPQETKILSFDDDEVDLLMDLSIAHDGNTDRVDQIFAASDGRIYYRRDNPGPDMGFSGRIENAEKYQEFIVLLGKIGREYNDTIEYHFNVWISPGDFLPTSTAIRVGLYNDGSYPIEAVGEYIVERETTGGWQKVEWITKPDPIAFEQVMPDGFVRHTLLFENLEGGIQIGKYRVSNDYQNKFKKILRTVEFTVSEDAWEVSYPPAPVMDEKHQGYYDRYLSVWGYYSPFWEAFDQQNYLTDFNTYHLFYGSAFLEAEDERAFYLLEYGERVPAQTVEDTIQRHFLVSSEQIQANATGGESYDPDEKVYVFPGGYGGGSSHGVVVDAVEQPDGLLILTCEWYGMDDYHYFTHRVTIQRGEETIFHYLKNEVLEDYTVG